MTLSFALCNLSCATFTGTATNLQIGLSPQGLVRMCRILSFILFAPGSLIPLPCFGLVALGKALQNISCSRPSHPHFVSKAMESLGQFPFLLSPFGAEEGAALIVLA
jgi:hypothetical protein